MHVFVCGVSRSGTTLLNTILDSHPAISMGYELLPPAALPPIGDMIGLLEGVDQDGEPLMRGLADGNKREVALASFLKSAHSARTGRLHLARILRTMRREGVTTIETFAERVDLAVRVVEHKRSQERGKLSGFKLNTSRFGEVEEQLEGSRFVMIMRDPRDVVASQRKRGFDRTVVEMGAQWIRHLNNFLALQERIPERTHLIRYEDLVGEPDRVLREMFTLIGLPYVDEVRRFYESDATIHASRHNNAPLVGKDLFSTSIGRWEQELRPHHRWIIRRSCGSGMERLGYS